MGSLREDLKAAVKAHDKLVTYCNGLPRGSAETSMYVKLNRQAATAIDKLPVGMRSRFALDIASLLK